MDLPPPTKGASTQPANEGFVVGSDEFSRPGDASLLEVVRQRSSGPEVATSINIGILDAMTKGGAAKTAAGGNGNSRPTQMMARPPAPSQIQDEGYSLPAGAYLGVPGGDLIRAEDPNLASIGTTIGVGDGGGRDDEERGCGGGGGTQHVREGDDDNTNDDDSQRDQKSESHDLAVANPVDDDGGEEDQQQDLGVAQPVLRQQQPESRGRRRSSIEYLKLLLLAMIALTLIVGFTLLFTTRESHSKNSGMGEEDHHHPIPSPQPTPLPTLAPTDLVLDSLPEYTLRALEDPQSPQSLAYQWLLNDPNLYDYRSWRRNQRFALATFFFATRGPTDWERNDGWLSYSRHECDWVQTGGWNSTTFNDGDLYSSTLVNYFMGDVNLETLAGGGGTEDCDETGHFLVVRQAANGLDGSLPNELSFLTFLRELLLPYNNLHDAVPTVLSRLTDLQQFHITNTKIESLPSELGLLSNIRMMGLDDISTLRGSQIPSQLGLLTNMHSIHLRNTQVGTIPSQFGQLENLRVFRSPGGMSVQGGRLPLEFFQLTKLVVLDATDMDLKGNLQSNIGQLTDLEYLNLGHNKRTGMLPSELFRLTKLRHLALEDNEISGALPTQVGYLSLLQTLNLRDNLLSGEVPTELGLLPKLKELLLQNNPQLSGIIPANICNTTAQGELNFTCSQQLCGCGICEEC